MCNAGVNVRQQGNNAQVNTLKLKSQPTGEQSKGDKTWWLDPENWYLALATDSFEI